MIKRICAIIFISILISGVAVAGESVKFYGNDGALMAWNKTDNTMHLFVCVYQWGCNGGRVQGPCPSFQQVEEGVDTIRTDTGRIRYTSSYFQKLAKYEHFELRGGEKRIIEPAPCFGSVNYKYSSVNWAFNKAEHWEKFQRHLKNADPNWLP